MTWSELSSVVSHHQEEEKRKFLMRIAYSLEQPLTDRPTLLTIGKFDGFHIGHQLLVRTATERARQCCCASAVLTFDPHPDFVVHPEHHTRLLTTLEERIHLIGSFEPEVLVVAPFNQTVKHMTAYEYMTLVHDAMPLRELWMGPNFALGHNREGTMPRLMQIGEELGYAVGSVAPTLVEGAPVSSSRIRKMLSDGIVEGIEVLLGRHFSLEGVVVEGDQRGRTIGFPTANLALDPWRALPANGVYACYAYLEGTRFVAVVNIGVRPTFGQPPIQTVEAHLIGWSGNAYGAKLRLEFWHRLRGEQKFSGIEELKAQIARDVARTRELFN